MLLNKGKCCIEIIKIHIPLCEVYDVFDYYSFGNVFMNTLKQHGCMKRRIN